ncbi:hypothetical protein ACVGV7_00300, partial [Enterobacter intestinihominis]
AQHMRVNRNLLAGVVHTPAYRRAFYDGLVRAFYWVEVVVLVHFGNRLAGEMFFCHETTLQKPRAIFNEPVLSIIKILTIRTIQ